MIIVYRKSDGAIMNGTNTNSAYPDGGPAEIAITNVTNGHGGIAEDYGVFRLHDEQDSELVTATLTHDFSLKFDQEGMPVGVIIGQRREAPPQPAPRVTEDEKEQLILSQSEMIALLFEAVLGGGVQ